MRFVCCLFCILVCGTALSAHNGEHVEVFSMYVYVCAFEGAMRDALYSVS